MARRTFAVLAAAALGLALARRAPVALPAAPGAARAESRVLGNGVTVVAVSDPLGPPTAALALAAGTADGPGAGELPAGWRVDRSSSRVTGALPGPEGAGAWLEARWREASAAAEARGGGVAPGLALVVIVGPEAPAEAIARVEAAAGGWSGPEFPRDPWETPPPGRSAHEVFFDLRARLSAPDRAAVEVLREALRAPGPAPIGLRLAPQPSGDWVVAEPAGPCDPACRDALRERIARAVAGADLDDLRARARVVRERALEEPADRADAHVAEWLAGREPLRVDAVTAALGEVTAADLQRVGSRIAAADLGAPVGPTLPRAELPTRALALAVSGDGRVVAGWDGLAAGFTGVLRIDGGWRDAPAACDALRALAQRRPGPAGARWTLEWCDPGEVRVAFDGPNAAGIPTLRALVDALAAGDVPAGAVGVSRSFGSDVAAAWAVSRAAPRPPSALPGPAALREDLAALARLPMTLAWFGPHAPDTLADALPAARAAPRAAKDPEPYPTPTRVRVGDRVLAGARFGPPVDATSAEDAVLFAQALGPRLAGTGLAVRLDLRPGRPAVLVARAPSTASPVRRLAAFLTADWSGALDPTVPRRREQPAAWLPALAVGGRPRAADGPELGAIAGRWRGSATLIDGVSEKDVPGYETRDLRRSRSGSGR